MAPEAEPASRRLGIWPENWDAFRLFSRVMGQWIVAPAGGVVGLQHAALPMWLDALEIPQKERRRVLDGMQVMEREAVRRINSKIH